MTWTDRLMGWLRGVLLTAIALVLVVGFDIYLKLTGSTSAQEQRLLTDRRMTKVATGGFDKLETRHFIILHRNRHMADYVAKRAEADWKAVARDLGDPAGAAARGKVTIMMARDGEEMAGALASDGPQAPGLYDLGGNAIFVDQEAARSSLSVVISHEVAHAVYHNAMDDRNGRIPWWMSEGFSQFQETRADGTTTELALTEVHFDLLAAESDDPVLDEPVGDGSAGQVEMFYRQSAAMVYSLVKAFGMAKFVKLSRRMAAGEKLGEALRRAYSPAIRNRGDFREFWTSRLKTAGVPPNGVRGGAGNGTENGRSE